MTTPRRAHPARFLSLALVAITLAGGMVVVDTPTAHAADCDRYVSDRGKDTNNGLTRHTAFRTLPVLASQLDPGQVGCVVDGSTLSANRTIRVQGSPSSPVTIRPEPGGRAVILGQMAITADSHDAVFTGLHLAGLDLDRSTFIIVAGDRITFTGNDITSPKTICIDIKKGSDGVVISHNRIHHCGTEVAWTSGDSGAHGIYIQEATNVRITQNVIDHNQYRGIQTWPGANGVVIDRNLFHANGTHVNLGHDGSTMTRNTTVTHNLMTAATLYRADEWKNVSSVYGYLPARSDLANLVADNCLRQDTRANGVGIIDGNGLTVRDNVFPDQPVRYVDSTTADYRLTSDSTCIGFGPDRIQPTQPPSDQGSVTCRPSRVEVVLGELDLPTEPSDWGYWFVVYAYATTGEWARTGWVYRASVDAPFYSWTSDGLVALDGPAVVETGGTAPGSPVWVLAYREAAGAWTYEWIKAGACAA